MTTPTPLELTQLRLGLLASGFVPLPAQGKAVRVPGWPTLYVDDKVIPSWEHQPTWTNTGLSTRYTPTFDIDIAQAKAAEAVEALVRAHYGEHGRILSRIGKAPKRAIPFRTSTPFRKIKVNLIAPDGSKGALEFLGDGQQFIAFGIHPDTNAPYIWQDGEQPGAVRLGELPEINQEGAAQLIDKAVEVLEMEHGFKRASATQAGSERTEFEPTATLVPEVHPIEVEIYRDYFEVINPDIDYDKWFKLCCALFNTLGPEAGKQVAVEWSKRGQKFKTGELERKWKGINAKSAYGYGRKTIVEAWAVAYQAQMSEQERTDLKQSIENIVANAGLAKVAATQTYQPPPNNNSKPSAAPDSDWPTMEDAAYKGVAGDLVRVISPHSEADPVALLLQFLVAFGMIAGRRAYYQVGDTKHYTNLYLAIIAATGERKGMAFDHVRARLEAATANPDPRWLDEHVKPGGLASGEGLINLVRDPITKYNPKTGEHEEIDQGVEDKRMLFMEAELANLFVVMARPGNNVSPLLRKAWDGGSLTSLTRHSSLKATDPLIAIIGHITKNEFTERISRTDISNGFANRFLTAVTRRNKILPFGGEPPEEEIAKLNERLQKIIKHTENLKPARFKMNDKASALWVQVYASLSDHTQADLLSDITARAEAQVVRLALIYALLDCAQQIDVEHLQAALAVWTYCANSARYIFGSTLGDEIADSILEALRNRGMEGMTRLAIFNLFHRHQDKARIKSALSLLERSKRARCEKRETGGRPIEIWFAL